MDAVKTKTIQSTETLLGSPATVVLFNDDFHTMDEVTAQIVKAIGCSAQRAEEIMMQAHTTGRAVVIAAHLERCEHVAGLLEQIGLAVEVE